MHLFNIWCSFVKSLIICNFLFTKHRITSKGISKPFCTLKSDLRSNWTFQPVNGQMSINHTNLTFNPISPANSLAVSPAGKLDHFQCLSPSGTESTEDMVTPNKRQKFKTFIERPPRGVSMFPQPGRERVGLCCALVLTSLQWFHCRDVTVNMLQVQTGFLGSGF